MCPSALKILNPIWVWMYESRCYNQVSVLWLRTVASWAPWAFLRGVWMCMFSPGKSASSHSPKTCFSGFWWLVIARRCERGREWLFVSAFAGLVSLGVPCFSHMTAGNCTISLGTPNGISCIDKSKNIICPLIVFIICTLKAAQHCNSLKAYSLSWREELWSKCEPVQ